MNIVELQNIKKSFPIHKGLMRRKVSSVTAVDAVNIAIKKGEVLGLVGESGCGKSTLARIIIKLINPDVGKILFQDRDITHLKYNQLIPIRNRIQIVFQDPYSSLDPLFSVRSILKEALVLDVSLSKDKVVQEDKMVEVLRKVGLAQDALNRFPHQFSGGQRQRIAIARALMVNPELLILDEPLSSLDVLIQMQILDLLKELQQNLSLSYLFISHNLNVVRKIATRIAVMYLGRIVEIADSEELFNLPLHPYTKNLIDSSLFKSTIKGEPASNIKLEKGCVFKERCPNKRRTCEGSAPMLLERNPSHFVACHFPLDRV